MYSKITLRKLVFANKEIYHIFNRGIDKRNIFTSRRELRRAVLTLTYYRFSKLPIRLSKALLIERNQRKSFFEQIEKNIEKKVEILSYCLMPNHFHFLLKQTLDNGIQKFIADFQNSYTKFYNTRHNKRSGPIFQGAFKAVHIEDNDQLAHISRYIHLNPITSFLVAKEKLEDYQWSSLPEYLDLKSERICSTKEVMALFNNNLNSYRDFLYNQIDYARKLNRIKHLVLE